MIGNEQVHPGQLDVRDDPEMVRKSFAFAGALATELLLLPGEIAKVFDSLPKTKLEQISKRDEK